MRGASWIGVAVAVVLLAAGAAAFAGRILVVGDPLPTHADAIVILAGSVPDRVLEAADLYRAGVAPLVVVTREPMRRGDAPLRARGVHLPEGDDLTLAALARLGVPPEATLVLRRGATSTRSEARTIARWACAHRLTSLVVVTSPPHTRRARLILRQAFGPAIALAVRPSRYDSFSPTRWWHIRRDQKTVLSEYEKLTNYWLREHWTIEPCGGLTHHGRPPR
jgi:uncharacterized SAM-binding protein YcdF (DUF218 family)